MELRDVLFGPLPAFGLMDAAGDPELFYRLVRSGQQFESLYAGEQGQQLAPFGPCLISLEEGNSLTDHLLDQGWGKAWCTYLHCSKSPAELRNHLRRFLTVRTADGQMIYFRFYDPRVLRQFLPTCSPEQAIDFFGPVAGYLVESHNPQTVLRFSHVDGRINREEIAVR